MKKISADFTLQVDGVKGVCLAAEAWAEDKILQKKIPVLACESVCIRGDIARRVANVWQGRSRLHGLAAQKWLSSLIQRWRAG